MTIVASTLQAIDALFEAYSGSGSPGCSLAVIQNGEIAYQQGYGLANLELNVPITPASVFNIGSMSKQFTAFAIVLLEAEGKLSFDDDIRGHLPEMHDFGKTITLRNLIHHTSGIRNSFPALLALAEWRDTDTTTNDDVLRLLISQRNLNFEPGTEFEYSNSNYALLARVCECASGQSFSELCKERIFTPLEMQNTYINASCFDLIPGRTHGYYQDDAKWFNAPLTDSVVGPTNIYTTVQDLARWDQNFYTGAVGGQSVIAQMHQQGRLNDGTALDYAFGLEVGPSHRYKGWQAVEHGGSQGGYASHMLRFPELRLSVVLLCNYFNWSARDTTLSVADSFIPERPQHLGVEQSPSGEIVSITLAEAQLAHQAGIYFNAERAALRIVGVDDGKLQFEGLDLIPFDENAFYFDVEHDTQVVFVPGDGGDAVKMKTVTPSSETIYTKVEAVIPTPDELTLYAGRYTNPELDICWTMTASEVGLITHRRKYMDSQLTPIFKDVFRDDWSPLLGYPTTYLVRFTRDVQGVINGLVVSGDGVRNMVFNRV